MREDNQFNFIKQKIIDNMVEKAPIIFINYNFEEKKLECLWKKINKRITIVQAQAYYNPQNPYECIFMNDYQDNLWKAYHMLELLYIDYIMGQQLKKENYVMGNEEAIQYLKERYINMSSK